MTEGIENQENKTNETPKVLTFKSGEEYKIKIETSKEFKESLFRDIYIRAGRNLKGIIEENIQNKEKESKWRDKNCREEETFFKSSYNNIIAFIGERGTGKSSSMISFAQAIKYMDTWGDEKVFEKKVDVFLKEKKCRFESIGVIDPSMFEEKDNILEIVIAKMFHHFNQRIEQPCSETKSPGKRELLKAFQNVYENLKTIQKAKHERLDSEVIEALSNLASGSNLKKSIVELVEEYLNFMGNGNKNTYFLLVIDDFDLNIRHAGEMAEQIRKYLVIPGVIILLAVKLDQLSSIIEQTYREKFRTMLDDKVNRMSSVEPQSMAYLYIEKLIPEDRRLYLPEIRKIENKDICLKIEPEKGESAKKPQDTIEEDKSPKKLEDTILELIYKKTGLIFLKQDYESHFLIPDNLRDLNSLYVMLHSLEDVDIKEPQKIGEKEKKKIKENLRRFEDYFFNTWIKNNLSLDEQNIIEDFLSVDIRQKNKFIVSRLAKKYKFVTYEEQKKIEASSETPLPSGSEIQTIMDKENNPLNISLGDVLFCLKKVFLYDDSFITKKFVFAIKTIYSLIFYKLLFIAERYENVQLLLGGSVYNPEDIQFIRKSQVGKRRDHRDEIDYSKVVAYFEKKEFKSDLELIHYFLIFLGKKDDKYREKRDIYYDKNTNLGEKVGRFGNATFNILAFVCFVYNPQRISERIYGETKCEKKSLCNNIEDWRNKFRAVLPIYSIEFLEKILLFDLKELKGAAKDEHCSYFNHFFHTSLRGSIEDIINKNEYLMGKDKKLENCVILKAYDKCPIISQFGDARKDFINYLIRVPSEILKHLNNFAEEFKQYLKPETKVLKGKIEEVKKKLDSFDSDVNEKFKLYSELKEIFEQIGKIKKEILENSTDGDVPVKKCEELIAFLEGLEVKDGKLQLASKGEKDK